MIKMQEQNRRLRTIRNAILPKLLSGELDVSTSATSRPSTKSLAHLERDSAIAVNR